MKKNKNQDERNPDIVSFDNHKELEDKIDAMLEVSADERKKLRGEKKGTKNNIESEDTKESTDSSAPELPIIKKKNAKVSVTGDDEDNSIEPTEPPHEPKEEPKEETKSKSKSTKKEVKKKAAKKPKKISVVDHVDEPDNENNLDKSEDSSSRVAANKKVADKNEEDSQKIALDEINDKPTEDKEDDKKVKSAKKKKGSKSKKNNESSDMPAKNDTEEDDDQASDEVAESITDDSLDDEQENTPIDTDNDKKSDNNKDPSDDGTAKSNSTKEDNLSNDEQAKETATEDQELDTEDSNEDADDAVEQETPDIDDEKLAAAIAEASEQFAKRKQKAAQATEDQELDTEDSHDVDAQEGGDNEEDSESSKPVSKQPDVMPGMVNYIAKHAPLKPTSTEKIIEDGTTDKVVEQIISSEGDELLITEDAEQAKKFAPPPKTKRFEKLRKILKSKKFLLGVFITALIAVGVIAAVPATRYAALNAVGVRSNMSLTIIDQKSLQPLKGVTVILAGQEQKTDKTGQVSFNEVKLGQADLVIQKRAYADVYEQIIIGWGSNPLGEQSLVPTGSQYAFLVQDFLSNKPVLGVEAVSGEYTALSDESGKILLTIDEPELKEITVEIIGENIRTESITLDLDDQSERQVQLVPARQQLFVSKRSGNYDLYSIDADGKNESLILPGTGSERDDLTIVPHSSKDFAAFVSTRDNKRNDDGFLLSTLTVIDVANKTNRSVISSERVQVIGWIDNRLVYVRVSEGESASSPRRHVLISYDVQTGETDELAANNYFNDVAIAEQNIYYAPAGALAAQDEIGLFRVEADGNNKQRIYNKEVWSVFRLSYDALTLAVQQDWAEYRLDGQSQPGSINEPASKNSRAYVPNPSDTMQLWVDNRDGKGVLLARSGVSNDDTILQTASGLRSPVSWLSDTVFVYRVVTGEQTADYTMSTEGGEARKITDVTNTNSQENWYYY